MKRKTAAIVVPTAKADASEIIAWRRSRHLTRDGRVDEHSKPPQSLSLAKSLRVAYPLAAVESWVLPPVSSRCCLTELDDSVCPVRDLPPIESSSLSSCASSTPLHMVADCNLPDDGHLSPQRRSSDPVAVTSSPRRRRRRPIPLSDDNSPQGLTGVFPLRPHIQRPQLQHPLIKSLTDRLRATERCARHGARRGDIMPSIAPVRAQSCRYFQRRTPMNYGRSEERNSAQKMYATSLLAVEKSILHKVYRLDQ